MRHASRTGSRATIEIAMLGRLSVSCGGHELGPRDFGGVKPKQLLEMLLLAHGQPIPKDRLAEQLWGAKMPQSPVGALETYISVLRRDLSLIGIPAAALVVTEPEAYRAAVELVDLDLDRFDRFVDLAAAAGPRESRALLEQALGLVRGDLLEDEPYADWVVRARDIRRARIIDATLHAAAAALADGVAGIGLDHARAVLARDEFSERAHQLVMLAHYMMGHQHAALQAYDACRKLLAEELGLDPTPQTRGLRTAILRQVDPMELLPGPVRIVQSAAKRGSARTHLIGRQEELALVSSRLASAIVDGGPALVVIEGTVGVGKSHLLEQICADVSGAKVGRAACSPLERELAYVPLALALRDALELHPDSAATLPAVAAILPEKQSVGRDAPVDRVKVVEALADMLREAGPVLLALDDVHYADKRTLAAISYLLRRAPNSRLAIVVSVHPDSHIAGSLAALDPTLRIALRPLSGDELASAGLAHLYEATGGFPGLVRRLASARAAELRTSAGEEALELAGRHGAAARRLLVAAAVLPQPIDVDMLAYVLGMDEEKAAHELDRLVAQHLLTCSAASYEFRASLLREALAATVSAARRNLLVRRAEVFATASATTLAGTAGMRRPKLSRATATVG